MPHGGPGGGGPPGGGPAGGGPGDDPRFHLGALQPFLGGLVGDHQQVRTVELPHLQELGEGEVGSLIAGGWFTVITPCMPA